MSLTSKAVTIRRAGTSLVSTFHRANPPLIWRFDLERNHSFTLALQGEEGEWELGVTSAKGEFYPIARFASREDADEAFAATSKALMKSPCRWMVLKVLGLVVVVIFAVILLFGVLIGRSVMMMAGHMLPTGLPQIEAPVLKSGVPEPADSVLQPPP
jgi:hypothetical protein